MKTLPLITFIIGGLLIFLLMKQCNSPEILDNSEEIKVLEDSLEAMRTSLTELEQERDSLLSIPPKIDKQIVDKEREVDQNIFEDSTNALVHFRQALTENQELPDASEAPTLRELGLSAKLMYKIPRLELKIDAYDEIVQKDQEIISNLNYQIDAQEDLRELQRLALLNCEQRNEDLSAWYRSPYFLMAVGAVGTIAIAFATGLAR